MSANTSIIFVEHWYMNPISGCLRTERNHSLNIWKIALGCIWAHRKNMHILANSQGTHPVARLNFAWCSEIIWVDARWRLGVWPMDKSDSMASADKCLYECALPLYLIFIMWKTWVSLTTTIITFSSLSTHKKLPHFDFHIYFCVEKFGRVLNFFMHGNAPLGLTSSRKSAQQERIFARRRQGPISAKAEIIGSAQKNQASMMTSLVTDICGLLHRALCANLRGFRLSY